MLYLVCLLQLLIDICWADRQLQFVQGLFRHGDRAPLKLPYPKDVYTEEYWAHGWGQLTNIGIQEAHELGQFLRSRYVNTGFVSGDFNPKLVDMRASEVDRAIVSAQSCLYGLFPAAKDSPFRWERYTDWQPIVFHSHTPGKPDLDCYPTAVECPLQKRLAARSNDTAALYYNRVYRQLFAYLSTVTGIRNFTYNNVDGIFDINRELLNGLVDRQPNWVFKRWPQYENQTTMEIISFLRTQRYIAPYDQQEEAKGVTGVTLKRWIERAVNVSRSKTPIFPRMLLFSSHDNTLYSLMSSFNVANNLMVPYAAIFIMEVYSTDSGKFEIELYYRNETRVGPYRLDIPGCEAPCPVDNLKSVYATNMLNDLEDKNRFCGAPLPTCHSKTKHSISWKAKNFVSIMFIPSFIYVFTLVDGLRL